MNYQTLFRLLILLIAFPLANQSWGNQICQSELEFQPSIIGQSTEIIKAREPNEADYNSLISKGDKYEILSSETISKSMVKKIISEMFRKNKILLPWGYLNHRRFEIEITENGEARAYKVALRPRQYLADIIISEHLVNLILDIYRRAVDRLPKNKKYQLSGTEVVWTAKGVNGSGVFNVPEMHIDISPHPRVLLTLEGMGSYFQSHQGDVFEALELQPILNVGAVHGSPPNSQRVLKNRLFIVINIKEI